MTETSTTRKWRDRVASWRASGLTADEFCARHGGAPTTLRTWSSRLGRAAPAVRLMKVIATETRRGTLVIEIGDARVRVEAALDRELLAMAVDVLNARPRRFRGASRCLSGSTRLICDGDSTAWLGSRRSISDAMPDAGVVRVLQSATDRGEDPVLRRHGHVHAVQAAGPRRISNPECSTRRWLDHDRAARARRVVRRDRAGAAAATTTFHAALNDSSFRDRQVDPVRIQTKRDDPIHRRERSVEDC